MTSNKKILITGGAGFIGSTLVKYILENTSNDVINLDALTYAGNRLSLTGLDNHERYYFEHLNICDAKSVESVLQRHRPNIVIHLAAESHVDRSIKGPADFLKTNIMGTFNLLERCREYWSGMASCERNDFRFHHVSTDEVYGDLPHPDQDIRSSDKKFVEESPYKPSSPYSASKASSDHLVRSWHRTYGLPTLITNSSNNYGPYQFPEKLIPVAIINALNQREIPVFGNGNQIRDWLYVEDHADALYTVATRGQVGETYNIGGNSEKRNIRVVEEICKALDEFIPAGKPHSSLIAYVADRPGHDLRYAVNAEKIRKELGWTPSYAFETAIRNTVRWYIDNQEWYSKILDGTYRLTEVGDLL